MCVWLYSNTLTLHEIEPSVESHFTILMAAGYWGIPNSLLSFWYLANRQQIMGLVYFDKRAFAYLINPVAPWQTTQFIMPVPNCLYARLSYLELNANTCLSLCSAGFSLWLRESRAGIEGEQCQPGTWCLIFACPCPSCPLGFLFCYCWAARNSPLRRTVSTTLQLTIHFFRCLFLYLVKLEVRRIVELFAGMSEHTNASLAWHEMNPKFKQSVRRYPRVCSPELSPGLLTLRWAMHFYVAVDQKAVLRSHSASLSLWMSVRIIEMHREWHGNVAGATGRAEVKAQFWHGSESHLIHHVTHLHRCHKAAVIPLGLSLSHRLTCCLSFSLAAFNL